MSISVIGATSIWHTFYTTRRRSLAAFGSSLPIAGSQFCRPGRNKDPWIQQLDSVYQFLFMSWGVVRSVLSVGDACQIGGVSCFGGPLSVSTESYLGDSRLSANAPATFGNSISVTGTSVLTGSLTVDGTRVEIVGVTSTVSNAYFGSLVSVLGMFRTGSASSVFGVKALGSSLSLSSFARLGSSLSLAESVLSNCHHCECVKPR